LLWRWRCRIESIGGDRKKIGRLNPVQQGAGEGKRWCSVCEEKKMDQRGEIALIGFVRGVHSCVMVIIKMMVMIMLVIVKVGVMMGCQVVQQVVCHFK
jgi:hypothetical protein